jgi:hypothetical protein
MIVHVAEIILKKKKKIVPVPAPTSSLSFAQLVVAC